MRTIIALVTALSLAACTPKHTAEVKTVVTDLSACTGVDLKQPVVVAGEAITLGMAIVGLIAAGPPGWATEIAALATKYGPQAVKCGAQIAKDLLHTPATGSDAGVGPSTGMHEETAEDRADQVLAQ